MPLEFCTGTALKDFKILKHSTSPLAAAAKRSVTEGEEREDEEGGGEVPLWRAVFPAESDGNEERTRSMRRAGGRDADLGS